MLPSNTVEIVKNLSKNDFKRFGDFLKSPYFNSKETLYQLFKEVEKASPDFKPEKFEYKRIYKKIYGGEYKEQTIKNLYSEFGGLLKKFIAHERLEKSELEFNISLIKGLSENKCYEASNKQVASLKKSINNFQIPEEDTYYYNQVLETKLLENSISMNVFDLDDIHFRYNSIIINLINFSLDTIYHIASDDSIVLKAYNVKKDFSEIQKSFFGAFDAEKYFNSESGKLAPPSLKVRYLSYEYIQNEITFEQYKALEDLIIENIDKFSVVFKLYAWQSLLYILILKLIPKDKKHYEDAFRVCDYFFKQKIYPNTLEPYIAKSLVRDVFGVALVLKKFDWAENFINEVWHYMDEDSREDEMNYSMGRLKFQTKKYEESLEYLSKVKFQVVDEKINVRFYYLMNYIELKSYQAAISMLNSIRQFYFESKELPEMYAVLTESSLKFFREIIRAEENNKKLDYSIYKEAQNAGRYYHKQYILAKMEQLVK
ncbi:MAG: hypothetical protein JST55_15160 [Bacteroidetes bacterium]|nr:hypothetical protein [Bacteroidota bacterium]